MTQVWVVYMIGCIECGVPSAIYGVFDNEADAKTMYDEMRVSHETWETYGGQGYWDYQEMTIGVINTNYPFEPDDDE